MIVAIHQPNFLPWLGYFGKIRRSDTFVFLDDVQTSRGSWINRVRVLVHRAPQWLTVPIRRNTAGGAILELMVHDGRDWRRRIPRTLEANYGRAPFFQETMDWLGPRLALPFAKIGPWNAETIVSLSRRLEIGTEFRFASHIPLAESEELRGSFRLAALCRNLGARSYLAGDGAQGYEDESAFATLGIAHMKNGFACVPYFQGNAGEFVPGLSIVDALCWIGFERTAELLHDHAQRTASRDRNS